MRIRRSRRVCSRPQRTGVVQSVFEGRGILPGEVNGGHGLDQIPGLDYRNGAVTPIVQSGHFPTVRCLRSSSTPRSPAISQLTTRPSPTGPLELRKPLEEEREILLVVLEDHSVETEIHVRRCGGDLSLVQKSLSAGGRRHRVWHVEYCSDSTGCGGSGTAGEIFLVLHSRLTEMHVNVYETRQHMKTASIVFLSPIAEIQADGPDLTVLDAEVGPYPTHRGDQSPVSDY